MQVGGLDETWTGPDYIDPDTGEVLPTWAEALDLAEKAPDAKPAHVMRVPRRET